MAYNTGKYLPQVLSDASNGAKERLKTVKMASSAVAFIGQFFDPYTGTNGAQTFSANQKIRGIIKDILVYLNGQYMSVSDANAKDLTLSGTFVKSTSLLNDKYTTGASNATATFPDLILYEEINITDQVIAYLGATGVPVKKGTTTGSDLLNYFIEPDPTYQHMLIESGVNSSATGLTFQIVGFTKNDKQVIVKLINADGAVGA
jgi:hypothetical protein